jgi:hypothetical protein
MKEYNHNYMAIPAYERPFTVAGTYNARDYSDKRGNVEKWYGIELIGEASIGKVVYRDETVDWTGVLFENGGVLYGNILSFTLISGQVKVSIH